MYTRISAKVALLVILSASWLSCEDDNDSPSEYDDDLYTRASVVSTYQAETHTFQKGCTFMKNISGYTGTGFMDYGGKGSLVEWNNVSVPSTGVYTLIFRYANGGSDGRQCAVDVDDKFKGSVSFSPSGSWADWKTVSIKVWLKAGKNKIRVTALSDGGPNLDKMYFITEGNGGASTSRCVEVAENKNAFLYCTNGGVIESIEFASYGAPKGTCTTGFTRGTCHATSTLSKVKASCLNRASCTVAANNPTFGDPCGGTFKKLAVEYTCRDGGTAGLIAKDFVGYYERIPILNDWHKVNISLENNQLWWKNASGRRWSLNYAGGILKTGSDCPYGVNVIEVEKQSGSEPIKSLKFLKGIYQKKTIDQPKDLCPDDPNKTVPGECGCGVAEGTCGCQLDFGHTDYCKECGPCDEGEGDCDEDSDCRGNLVCVQQDGVDYCREKNDDDEGPHLQVKIDGTWKGVDCGGNNPRVSASFHKWNLKERVLTHRSGKKLKCPEGHKGEECTCSSSGERMHGGYDRGSGDVRDNLEKSGGGPIFPDADSGHHFLCLKFSGSRLIQVDVRDDNCTYFRYR